MPVLSPHRSSASGLTGSYRSTFGSSSLDRPFYGTGSYSPRFSSSSYTERYTSRSYTDSDGRRVFSRTGSITEDGLTTRFREESREGSTRRDSLSRDSGIGSIREGSILRDQSLTRSGADNNGRASEGRLSAVHVVETVADLRNKYSPANYVPAHLRNKDAVTIARSKTLNDIGLPPIESKARKVTAEPPINLNNTSARELLLLSPNNTNNIETTDDDDDDDNMYNPADDNGNRPSVSEMRKKFDKTPTVANGRPRKLDGGCESSSLQRDIVVRLGEVGRKSPPKSETNGRLLLRPGKETIARRSPETTAASVRVSVARTDSDQSKVVGGRSDGLELRGSTKLLEERKKGAEPRTTNHVNNFASYIPTKDFDKGDAVSPDNDVESINCAGKIKKINKDPIASSPTSRLNRSPIPHNACTAAATTTNNSSATALRGSTEKEAYRMRDFDNGTDNNDHNHRRFDRSSPGKQLGLNGLKNIGNTCFMNSVIQCMSNTKPLLEYVKENGHVSDINTTVSSMKGALIKAFAQVIKELWSEDSSDRVVNTLSLKSQIQRFAPRFIGYSQQDAQEFLRYLLEGLHEDVNRIAAKPTPIHTEIDEKLSDSEKASESWTRYVRRENSKIVDLFVGQLKSTLKCTHCGHCSVTFDPFWDLSLPIPQKVGSGVRLSQCLESFTREETLDGDEKPTCSKCKERRKCTKSFTIHKFPKILVIHLKRFSPTERFRGKLSVNVDFPLEGLDMSNYAAEQHTQCRYNLYAISNHSGTTYSGHYTAYCRHPYSMSWHEYNDSRVSTISAKSVVSGEAYVLFYELDSKLSHL